MSGGCYGSPRQDRGTDGVTGNRHSSLHAPFHSIKNRSYRTTFCLPIQRVIVEMARHERQAPDSMIFRRRPDDAGDAVVLDRALVVIRPGVKTGRATHA